MSDARRLRIGELAARTGVSVDALRYYDRLGVLRPAGRTEGRFRLYALESVARVRFVKRAQQLGLTLTEISVLLALEGQSGRAQCRRMRDALTASIADVDERLGLLAAFRDTLTASLSACERALGEQAAITCPVVGRFEQEDP